MTIIAIGGGGFTHGTDPKLDDFVLARCRTRNPDIGYIGTANRDMPERVERFHARFATCGGKTSHLLRDSEIVSAGQWAHSQDIIYVGGGETPYLLDSWRASGLDRVLCDAAKGGTLLAGVSAGAVCWFDFALYDIGNEELALHPGLGLVRGACCPHTSTEPGRQVSFLDRVATGESPEGIAIDDGAAVLIDGDKPPRAFSARAGSSARYIRYSDDGAYLEPVPPFE